MFPSNEHDRPGVCFEKTELRLLSRYSGMASRLLVAAQGFPLFATSIEVGIIIRETDQYRTRDPDMMPITEELFDNQLKALRGQRDDDR